MYRLTTKIIFVTISFFFILFFICYLFTKDLYHLILVTISGCGSSLSLLILMPPTRKEKGGRIETYHLRSVDESDVWIYVSDGVLYLPWYNATSKEIGPCRLFSQIQKNFHPGVLILPKGTKLSKFDVDVLSNWVDRGASLLCECPNETLETLTGLAFSGRKYDCRVEQFLKTSVDLTGATGLFYDNSENEMPKRDTTPSFFFEKRIGKGFVFSLAIEYGEWIRNTTQGKPNRSNGRFSKKFDWNMQGMQTPDLRTDYPRPFVYNPVVDVFDQTLFGYIRDKLRIPAWWYYPQAKSSAFVLTFDEDWFGKGINSFSAPGIPATWFVVDSSDIDSNTLDYLGKQGGTIQFHWNRFILHLNKFGWHFCLRNAKEQLYKMSKKTGTYPIICRIHYLRWDSDFDNLFFVMKEAGVEIDSSFGPGRGQHGYRFGTGFPYFVSDKEGNPIGIEEVSFQMHEPMGGASIEDHLRLLKEAVVNYHTSVVALFHPYYCLSGGRSYESYKSVLKFLTSEPVWCTNLEKLVGYWNERRKRKILSHYEGRNLVIKVLGLRHDQMTLRLPDPDNIHSVFLDGEEAPIGDKLILDPGDHIITVEYGG